MSVEIKETSATVRTLEVAIPQADLEAPFEKKLSQYKKQVALKGFRQGMVPKAMILKQFG
ncbi:MAG: trigger factor family protein, partial [Fibrobacter sp.]|nr:trigger factor family protein [Fibrobacter sp.]